MLETRSRSFESALGISVGLRHHPIVSRSQVAGKHPCGSAVRGIVINDIMVFATPGQAIRLIACWWVVAPARPLLEVAPRGMWVNNRTEL